jgi:hypothetical protein
MLFQKFTLIGDDEYNHLINILTLSFIRGLNSFLISET